MAMYGTFRDLGPAELLQWISSGSRSGIITATTPQGTTRLIISSGRVVHGSSDRIPRLGQVLVEKRLVAAEDLEQLHQLSTSPKGPRPLGAALLDRQLLTREQLERELGDHIRSVVAPLLTTSEGRWKFQPLDIPTEQVVLESGLEVESMLESLSAPARG